jgi:putative membrane protein insertion efficiency factor
MVHRHQHFLLFLLASSVDATLGACQSCLIDLSMTVLLGHNANNNDQEVSTNMSEKRTLIHSSASPLTLLMNPPGSVVQKATRATRPLNNLKWMDSTALRFLVVRELMSVASNNRDRSRATNKMMPTTSATVRPVRMKNKSRWSGGFFTDEVSETNNSLPDDNKNANDTNNSKSGEGEDAMSGSMIMAIGFYKQWISPLLPPACRFLPTCSQYGAQAIREFGPTKGVILTAWRLARCTPLGGRGYDPPKWPPVSYNYGSY